MFPGGTYMGASAPYPATNYPAKDFFGAIALQPDGAKADNPMTPSERNHTIGVIVVLVVGGLLLWHLNYRR